MSDANLRAPYSIAAMWARFERAVLTPSEAPPEMVSMLRMAFYAGVTSMFAELMQAKWTDDSIAAMQTEIEREGTDMLEGRALQ
jgi:hypothetical protein